MQKAVDELEAVIRIIHIKVINMNFTCEVGEVLPDNFTLGEEIVLTVRKSVVVTIELLTMVNSNSIDGVRRYYVVEIIIFANFVL